MQLGSLGNAERHADVDVGEVGLGTGPDGAVGMGARPEGRASSALVAGFVFTLQRHALVGFSRIAAVFWW